MNISIVLTIILVFLTIVLVFIELLSLAIAMKQARLDDHQQGAQSRKPREEAPPTQYQ